MPANCIKWNSQAGEGGTPTEYVKSGEDFQEQLAAVLSEQEKKLFKKIEAIVVAATQHATIQ